MKLLKKIKQKLKKYFCKEAKIQEYIPRQIPKPMEYEPITIIAKAVLWESENRMFTKEQIVKMYQEELSLKIANELLKHNLVEILVKNDEINFRQKSIYARIKVLNKKQ